MPSTSPAKPPRRRIKRKATAGALAVALLAAGLTLWTLRTGADAALPASPLALQTLAGAGQRDDALARLRSQAEEGSTLAQRALGEVLVHYRSAGPEAATWLEHAARSGDAEAGFELGKLFQSGAPGLPADPIQAANWFRKAAVAGHGGAAYRLGIAHRNGSGVRRDAAEAARWFRLAADKDVPAAMFMLANAYREGDGVPLDESEALHLYEAAAELEHPESIQALAMAHRNGELGLRPDEGRHRLLIAEAAHALKHPALTP